jgi:hypothetical protein
MLMARRLISFLLGLPLVFAGLVGVRSGAGDGFSGPDAWTYMGTVLLTGGLIAIGAAMVGPQRRLWRISLLMTGVAYLALAVSVALIYIGLSSEPT